MALLLYSCISVHLCLLAPDLQWRWHMCIVGCGERAAAAEFPRSHSWCPVPGPRPIWDWKHFCLWGESERERERDIFCGLVWDSCGLLQGKPCNSLLCVWFSLNYDEETGILLENNSIFFVRLCVSVYLYVCVCVVRAVIWRPMCGTCALDRTFNLLRATSLTSTAWSGSYSFKKLKWITVSWFYKWKMDHFFDRH